MSILIILMTILLYFGFVYWFARRYYLPWYNAGVPGDDGSASSYRLARTIRRILGFFHYLVFYIVMIAPVIFLMTMVTAYYPNAEWGNYIYLYSGFKLDLSLLPTLETSGLLGQEISGNALMKIKTSSLFSWQLFLIMIYLRGLYVLFIVLQLRHIFLSLSIGEAFTSANASRLKKIAVVILAWHVATPILGYFSWGAMLERISFNTQALKLDPVIFPDLIGIFIGVTLLVLSGVINEAVKMHDEQRLTI